ncbi:MAG: hypothetical protein GF375_02210, partial [Candidatus Omnitrophica bacterium]|nr:hypothetical protein [Candidatus Omnitrophota bacterium]MBD3268928.1 hypothetical protein [Candidatus Omnitrophota bacterium]
MRKLFLLFLILFVCSCADHNDYTQVKVKEVIDGDTVILENGEMLRYLGIDTPEVRVREGGDFQYLPQPFSLEAKRYNEEVAEGRYIRVEFDVQRRDRYGRLLGYCFAKDVFINAKMVEEGFAVIYTRPPNLKYAEHLLGLQRKARAENKGLWGVYPPISPVEAAGFINQIRSVRGEVK